MLIKWWLLAIPQYVVVAILAGGWGIGSNADGSAGLISVLVLIAAVVLLFTGRYPQGLFDFVLGLSRWCFRVLVYALLLRDEYPPFRLDTGGTDPSGPVPTSSVVVG